MSENDPTKDLSVIREMPVVSKKTWERLRSQFRADQKGTMLWSIGADIVRKNPDHKEAYEEALRDTERPEFPDATSGIFLLVHEALKMQAEEEGHKLPELSSPVNPMPALREFMPRIRNRQEWEIELMDIAYGEILNTNPIIGEIINYIAAGAPDEFLRATTEAQGKRGAVYAYYVNKSAIIK